MRDGRSTAYLAGLQTPTMRGAHPSLNNVATAVVVVGIVVGVVRIVVSVVVPVAIRPVAVAVPVVVAMKSSNDGTGAKTVEAAIVGSSNDGAGAKAVKSSSESATVESAAAKAAHASSVEATATTKAAAAKAAAPVSAATATSASAAASTAACLCTRREQRAGKEGGCQYHHRFSSSHESFLSTGRAVSDHRTSRLGPHVAARLRIANGKFRRQ